MSNQYIWTERNNQQHTESQAVRAAERLLKGDPLIDIHKQPKSPGATDHARQSAQEAGAAVSTFMGSARSMFDTKNRREHDSPQAVSDKARAALQRAKDVFWHGSLEDEDQAEPEESAATHLANSVKEAAAAVGTGAKAVPRMTAEVLGSVVRREEEPDPPLPERAADKTKEVLSNIRDSLRTEGSKTHLTFSADEASIEAREQPSSPSEAATRAAEKTKASLTKITQTFTPNKETEDSNQSTSPGGPEPERTRAFLSFAQEPPLKDVERPLGAMPEKAAAETRKRVARANRVFWEGSDADRDVEDTEDGDESGSGLLHYVTTRVHRSKPEADVRQKEQGEESMLKRVEQAVAEAAEEAKDITYDDLIVFNSS